VDSKIPEPNLDSREKAWPEFCTLMEIEHKRKIEEAQSKQRFMQSLMKILDPSGHRLQELIDGQIEERRAEFTQILNSAKQISAQSKVGR
jgi:hypothetical protein